MELFDSLEILGRLEGIEDIACRRDVTTALYEDVLRLTLEQVKQKLEEKE